ncbi:MAG: ribosome hibernation-promoting factor, HPF/YfiA family [Desulfovibrionaceae bacterium]|nr:ribosome-associated translation inhibitor RaiA [Desulfovibrionaceae bacterium]
MNITFTFKNFEPSDHLKKYARRRMEKLGRFFGKSAGLEVQVVLAVDKFRHTCEVAVAGEGLHLAASESSQEMYASIDLVTDKLEAQIKKHVSRSKEQRRTARDVDVDVFRAAVGGEEEDELPVIGTDRFAQKPLLLDEAIMQLDASSNDFLVFVNADSSRVNVVYRRRNGKYGLIDPVI